MSKNIVLIGFMGSGKTGTSLALGKLLGWEVCSTDALVEEQAGQAISEIFASNGEKAFRELESWAVQQAACKENVVIDCGGGVIKDSKNYTMLKKTGRVIYLKTSPQVLHERTRNSTHRPLLNVDHPLQKIQDMLLERESYYQQADMTVDTDGRTVEDVAQEISERIIHD